MSLRSFPVGFLYGSAGLDILDILRGSFSHCGLLYNICACTTLSVKGEMQGVVPLCWPCCNCREKLDHSGCEGKWGVKLKPLSSGSLRSLVSLSPRRKKNNNKKEEEREEKGVRERVQVSNLVLINDSKSRYQFSLGIFFWSRNQWSLSRSEVSALHWLSTLGDHFFLFFFLFPFVFFKALITTYKKSCMRSVWGWQIFHTCNNRFNFSSMFLTHHHF